MDKLVKQLTIPSEGEKEEWNLPEKTWHPVYHHFYQCLQHRALNPRETTLPELHPALLEQFSPQRKAQSDTKDQIGQMFPVNKRIPLKRLKQILKQEDQVTVGSKLWELRELLERGQVLRRLRETLQQEVDIMSQSDSDQRILQSLDPIEAFNDMIADRTLDKVTNGFTPFRLTLTS